MPTGRLITLCITLFLTSSLISLSVRKSHSPNSIIPSSSSAPSRWHALLSHLHLTHPSQPYAFATFLSSGDPTSTTGEDPTPHDPAELDGYYLSTRMLAYQFLHAPSTATPHIPFLVLAAQDVSPYKLARLRADGATVIMVDPITSDWITPNQRRWEDVLTKLRVFQLVQYDKICYLDADTLLFDRLAGIFLDPTTEVRRTNESKEALHDHEGNLPNDYAFAGVPDMWSFDHAVPMKGEEELVDEETRWEVEKEMPSLNSGFFVARPDLGLFEYYRSLLQEANKEKLQYATFPDQDVLNYAHRDDGNMPWARLKWGWNANWATSRDVEAGAKSVHAKFWEEDPGSEDVLNREWERVRAEMRAFYRGFDDGKGGVRLKAEEEGEGGLV